MMPEPISTGTVGMSPNTVQPRMTAQTMDAYWNGARSDAGARFRARVMQTKQAIDTIPTENISPRSSAVGVTQTPGLARAPTTPAPTNCQVVRVSQCVRRSLRVIVMAQANMKDPKSAIRAVDDTAAPLGRSATSTPAKPTRTAPQRNASTASPRIGQDSAVMMSGAAR